MLGGNGIVADYKVARGITDYDNRDGPELLDNVNPTFTWVRLAQRSPRPKPFGLVVWKALKRFSTAACAALSTTRPSGSFLPSSVQSEARDGSTFDVAVSGKPIFDPNGRFLGYRGVSTDVSDTVRANNAERALQDVRMELAHVSRITSLGALTASIAHEINQPLTSVISMRAPVCGG